MQEGPKVTVPSPDLEQEQVSELEEIRHAPMSAMITIRTRPLASYIGWLQALAN